MIVWIDEAGFYLLAGAVRSYAPRGQTPILRVPLTRDHLSVISAITAQGQLLAAVQARAFHGGAVVRFLKHVVGHLSSRVLIIWDGAPIHHDQCVSGFVAEQGGQLCVEQLPAYAPDLNPDEGVWDQLKYVELKNVICHEQKELRHELRLAIARLRQKPDLICRFIEHYGY